MKKMHTGGKTLKAKSRLGRMTSRVVSNTGMGIRYRYQTFAHFKPYIPKLLEMSRKLFYQVRRNLSREQQDEVIEQIKSAPMVQIEYRVSSFNFLQNV